MTPEQIAAELVTVEHHAGFSAVRIGMGLHAYEMTFDRPQQADSMAYAIRQTIKQALPLATVDDAMRAEAKKVIDELLKTARNQVENPPILVRYPAVMDERTREDATQLSEDARQQLEHMTARMAEQIHEGGSAVSVPRTREWEFVPAHRVPDRYVQRLDRLAFLIGLSSLERSFIHTYEDTHDPASWLVFADWLDEQNKPEEATRFRTLFPQPGQVAVLTFPRPGSAEHVADLRSIAANFQRVFNTFTVMLFADQTLEMLNEAEMASNGWVRLDWEKRDAQEILGSALAQTNTIVRHCLTTWRHNPHVSMAKALLEACALLVQQNEKLMQMLIEIQNRHPQWINLPQL